MQETNQLCPICYSSPKYRDAIIYLADYISKEAKLILTEHTLDKVMLDAKMDDFINNNNTNFFNFFMDAGKTVQEANELSDKHLILQGRLNALTDILKQLEKFIK